MIVLDLTILTDLLPTGLYIVYKNKPTHALKSYSLCHQLQCSGQGLGELGVVLHPLPAAILNDVIGQVHECELTADCSCVCMHM